MKVAKLGHCCLLIEEAGVRILTDPGTYTTRQNEVAGVDAVLITHEHKDHFHVESVERIIENNPNVQILTNRSVGKFLDSENIAYRFLEDGGKEEIRGVKIEAYGDRHQELYKTLPTVVNTGYMIGGRFFYPGDAFPNPRVSVEILALPIAGPWLKLSEALEYAIALKPKVAFPVHDGMLKFFLGYHTAPPEVLKEAGIEFLVLEEGKVYEW